MNIKDRFENVGFTPEEKIDLTARLERAAEQEENMTNATKRKIKRISGGMIFGVAAAVVMTAGALAAVLNPGLLDYFDTAAPGASETLESSIYRIDRSQTYQGWTVTLGECVGDGTHAYLAVEVTAPEGMVLTETETSPIDIHFSVQESGQGPAGTLGSGGLASYYPDADPTDNRHTFYQEIRYDKPNQLQDCVLTLFVGPLTQYDIREDTWNTLADYQWTFEDVTLDYPDQTLHLELDTPVPYLDGTAMLTEIEVSPLQVAVRLEGGSCDAFLEENVPENPNPPEEEEPAQEEVVLELGGVTLTQGRPTAERKWKREYWNNCLDQLTIEIHLKDGTIIEPSVVESSSYGYDENIQDSYAEKCLRMSETLLAPIGVIDPAQIHHITVCGVDIPVTPEAPQEAPAAPAPQEAPSAAVQGVVIPKRGLNVRSGPGASFQVLSAARRGTKVTVLGEEQGFYKVSCPDGTVGYAAKQYISIP